MDAYDAWERHGTASAGRFRAEVDAFDAWDRRRRDASPTPSLRPDSAIDWETSEHLRDFVRDDAGGGAASFGDVPPPSIDFSISSKNSVDRWWRARGEPVERAAMTGTGMAPAPGTPGTESIVVAENIATSTVPVPVPARVSRRRFLHDVRARASWATPREVTPTTPRTNATTSRITRRRGSARETCDSTRLDRRGGSCDAHA